MRLTARVSSLASRAFVALALLSVPFSTHAQGLFKADSVSASWTVGAAARLTITSSTGYVGIGTASPNSLFEVNGAATVGTLGSGLIAATGISITTNQTSVTSLYASGNVGIGTAAPAYPLDVSGTLRVSSNLYANQLTINGGSTLVRNSGSLRLNSTGAADDVAIYGGGSMPQASIIVKSTTGLVGISTTVPSTTLHVSGTLRIANGGETCDTNRAGAIRYTNGDFQVCYGSGGWASLVDASGTTVTPDRITSGTTNVYARSDGSISFTTAGVTTGYFYNGQLVANGVSTTGSVLAPTVSATALNAYYISGTSIAGILSTAAQPNITSVGTLTGLTVNGTLTMTGATNTITATNVYASSVSGTTGTFGSIGVGSLTGTGTLSSTNIYGQYASFTALTVGGVAITGAGAASDAITSSTTKVTANSTGTISFTTNGTVTNYLTSAGLLVTPGISTTGPVSITASGLYSLYADNTDSSAAQMKSVYAVARGGGQAVYAYATSATGGGWGVYSRIDGNGYAISANATSTTATSGYGIYSSLAGNGYALFTDATSSTASSMQANYMRMAGRGWALNVIATSSTATSNFGVNSTLSGKGYAVYANAASSTATSNYGVYSYLAGQGQAIFADAVSSTATNNYGIYSMLAGKGQAIFANAASSTATGSVGTNYGVLASLAGGGVAIFGKAISTTATDTFGVAGGVSGTANTGVYGYNTGSGYACHVGASTTALTCVGPALVSSWTMINAVATPTTPLEVSGTVSATRFVGDGSLLTNLPAASSLSWYGLTAVPTVLQNISNTTGSVTVTTVNATTGTFTDVAGILSTAAQPNITSVGTLTGLTVNGTLTMTGATNTITATNVYASSVSGTTGTFGSIGVGSLTGTGTLSSTNIYGQYASFTALTVGGVAITGAGAASDAITSSTTKVTANSAGSISFTTAGTTTGYFYNGQLVANGVSTTGSVLAPTVSATAANSTYASTTNLTAGTATLGSLGSGLIAATGISLTTNQLSATTAYMSNWAAIGTMQQSTATLTLGDRGEDMDVGITIDAKRRGTSYNNSYIEFRGPRNGTPDGTSHPGRGYMALSSYTGSTGAWMVLGANSSSGDYYSDLATMRNNNQSMLELSSGGILNFWTSGSNNIRFYATGDSFLTGGSLGLGTSLPSTTLHISGTVRISNGGETCDANRAGAIRYTNGDFQVCYGSGGWASLVDASGTTVTPDRITSGTTNVYARSDGSISFTTAGTTTGYFYGGKLVASGISVTTNQTSVTTLYASGNIGIGTAAPNAKLDVNGTISATTILSAGTMKLGKYTSQPVACAAGYDGYIALTSQYTTCVCKGASSAWVHTSDGATACSW